MSWLADPAGLAGGPLDLFALCPACRWSLFRCGSILSSVSLASLLRILFGVVVVFLLAGSLSCFAPFVRRCLRHLLFGRSCVDSGLLYRTAGIRSRLVVSFRLAVTPCVAFVWSSPRRLRVWLTVEFRSCRSSAASFAVVSGNSGLGCRYMCSRPGPHVFPLCRLCLLRASAIRTLFLSSHLVGFATPLSWARHFFWWASRSFPLWLGLRVLLLLVRHVTSLSFPRFSGCCSLVNFCSYSLVATPSLHLLVHVF